MQRTLAVLVTSTAFAAAGAPAAIAGQGNPSGTGPPNQTCQLIEGNNNNVLPSTGAGSSPGSVFNEGTTTTSPGIGGTTYNNVGAPSQYDVACYQTNLHH